MPKEYRPRIALIGAGRHFGGASRRLPGDGLDVAVIASRTLSRAKARRDEYFPSAEATDDIKAR